MRIESLEPRVVLSGGTLVISEFMAANTKTLVDRDGESADWIEIHNPTDEAVVLDGWYLTDNANDLSKWRFPLGTGDLAPGGRVVVMASGKNLRVPGEELHTNFQLSARGEYLALVKPNGDTIAHDFGESYPWQFEDISYGLTQSIIPLVGEGVQQTWHVPDVDDAALATEWTTLGYDDSSWEEFIEPPPVLITEVGTGSDDWVEIQNLADSPVDTSGWVVAANNPKADEGVNGLHELWHLPNSIDALEVLYQTDEDEDAEHYWGDNLIWSNSGDGWVMIVDDSGNVADFVAWGDAYDGATLATLDVNINGFQIAGADVWFGDAHPDNTHRANTLQRHGSVDHDDVTDWGFLPTVQIEGEQNIDLMAPFPKPRAFGIGFDIDTGELNPSVQIDVAAAMQNTNGSLWTRVPFAVPDVDGIATIQLRMKYDDGFIAYVNGREIARRNAPDVASWDALATAEREAGDASVFETIELADFRDVLFNGENVLAIHALNVSPEDPTLLVVSDLTGEGSRYFAEPSPLDENGEGFDIEGPIISNLTENPPPPTTNDPLVITAQLTETFDPVGSVTLHYRIMFEDEVAVAMLDDGIGEDAVARDGIYTAVIPAVAYTPGEMVRWRVTSSDIDGDASRFPYFLNPKDSPEYYGTVVVDPSLESSNLPVLHWFVDDPSGANTESGERGAVYFLGEFYDNMLADIHGQSSRGFPKKSYDFDFNKQYRFKYAEGESRVKDINLLTNWADKAKVRNTMGYEVYRDAGAPYHFAFPVRVQQNGQFFSTADLVEDGDEDYLDRLGLDPGGALYKMYNTLNGTGGGEKKTRLHENKSDLQALINGTRLTGDARTRFFYDNINIPEVVNFLAATIIIGTTDMGHKNYYVYCDTNGTGEWQVLPWDVDLSFGRNWTQSMNYFDDRVYFGNNLFIGSGNALMGALFNTPSFREMYLRRVRTLMDEQLQPPGTLEGELRFEKRLDELLALIDPHDDADPANGTDDADLDYVRWGSWGNRYTMQQDVERIKTEYLPQRRDHLYNQLTIGNGGEIPAAQPAYPQLIVAALEADPVSGNQDEEYIAIRNDNYYAVDISGWHLAEGVEFTFQGGTVIPSGGTLFVSPDVTAFRARANGPSGNKALFVQGPYRGHLSSFGETVRLVHADGTEISTLTYDGTPSATQDHLRISEVMYNPPTPTMEETAAGFTDGDFEYIELVNTADVPLALEGVHFTEGVVFTFPARTLQPGKYILVVANRPAFEMRYGTENSERIAGEFVLGNLSNGGERLKLEDVDNGTILDFTYSDSGSWPEEADGVGASLQWADPSMTDRDAFDSGMNWRYSVEYLGSPGVACEEPDRRIVITEVLSSSVAPVVDAIELYNASSEPVDVGGMWLSDSAGDLMKYRIPEETTIPAGGYLVFDEHHFNPGWGNDPVDYPKDFALDSTDGDDVWLLDGDADGHVTRFVDHVEFGAALPNETFGRWPGLAAPMVPMDAPTLGGENSGPRVGPLIISEVMYHAGDRGDGDEVATWEFVEIHNPTGDSVDLTDWRIRGGIDYDFDDATMIGPSETIVVVTFDPHRAGSEGLWAEFCRTYGFELVWANHSRFFGGFSGRLDNGGETVRLIRPGTPVEVEPGVFVTPRYLEDEVTYDDVEPWPLSADGQGHSLHRVDPGGWGNNATSWMADIPTPGETEYAVEAADVVGRHVFYNNSWYDGQNALANALDDKAIASDKAALLPGATATFANYTNYVRGINGVMVDIAGLHDPVAAVGLDNFELKVGNDDAPQGWANAPAPVSVTVRPGMGIGGADRVSIIWPDGAIVGQWLQVSVLATPATGLEAEDVFFFGNAIGDTGNSPTDALVTVTDELATRSSYRGLADLAPIDEVTDFNRDRLVNVTDRIITRNHCGGLGGALELITAPAVDRMDVDLGAVLAAASDSIEFSWLAEIELEVPSTRGESTNAEMRKHAAIDQLLASLAE